MMETASRQPRMPDLRARPLLSLAEGLDLRPQGR